MIDSIVFPSDNSLGIPVLKPELQGKFIEKPCYAWGNVPRNSQGVKTWHFYTDDYRWNALLKKPWQVVDTYPTACAELNISMWEDTAPALALADIYKKRWVARYWQESGVRIFVDLFVPQPLAEFNLLGVPKGWQSYATRGVSRDLEGLDYDFKVATEHAGGDVIFVVVGGGADVADWCAINKAIHLAYRIKKDG